MPTNLLKFPVQWLTIAVMNACLLASHAEDQLRIAPSQIDLGVIYDTAHNIEVQTEYENLTTSEISISNISWDCGCTSAKLDKYLLAPGEKGSLRMAFDPSHKTGHFLLQAQLAVSNEVGKTYSFLVKGYVTDVVKIVPQTGTITLRRNAPASTAVSIFLDRTFDKWVLIGADAPDKRLTVKLLTTEQQSSRDGTTDVMKEDWAVIYDGSQMDYFGETIRTELAFRFQNSEDTNQPLIRIKYPLIIKWETSVQITPNSVIVVIAKTEESVQKYIRVSDKKGEFDDLKVHTDITGATVRATKISDHGWGILFELTNQKLDIYSEGSVICSLSGRQSREVAIPVRILKAD